jgi:hypothetical protein
MVYNPNKAKDGKMAFEGGNASFHDVDSGNVYGTHEGDRTEGSHAPDVRIRRSLGKSAVPKDSAEQWLKDNDPDYKSKRNWNG